MGTAENGYVYDEIRIGDTNQMEVLNIKNMIYQLEKKLL